MNLPDAVRFCQEGGGRVYEPRDNIQQMEVEARARDAALIYGYWLGISDRDQEGL